VLGSSRGYQRAALIWLQRMREAKLLQVEAPPDYASIVTIMERYADLPCDFADATLIDLSERTGVFAIATVDQRDFSVYRSLRGKRFKIVLTS